MGKLVYGLSEQQMEHAYLGRMAVSHGLMMPMARLQEEASGARLLTADDVLCAIWGVEDAILGLMPSSVRLFEQRLLPEAESRGPIWHGCVMLWCALFRLYICDSARALEHIGDAEGAGLSGAVPEIELVKGMALRLEGAVSEAVSVLRPLVRRGGLLFPDQRTQALAWLIESEAAVGRVPAEAQRVRWLSRRNRNIYQGSMGIVLAALYRLSIGLGTLPKMNAEAECALLALDQTPVFERPLLTALLQDVLPRPLAGVEALGVSLGGQQRQ